jgi:hypothetical protein
MATASLSEAFYKALRLRQDRLGRLPEHWRRRMFYLENRSPMHEMLWPSEHDPWRSAVIDELWEDW